MNRIKHFQDLEIWQDGKNLTVLVYKFTQKEKFNKDF